MSLFVAWAAASRLYRQLPQYYRLHGSTSHCTTLQQTAPRYTATHDNTLHHTILHHNTGQYSTVQLQSAQHSSTTTHTPPCWQPQTNEVAVTRGCQRCTFGMHRSRTTRQLAARLHRPAPHRPLLFREVVSQRAQQCCGRYQALRGVGPTYRAQLTGAQRVMLDTARREPPDNNSAVHVATPAWGPRRSGSAQRRVRQHPSGDRVSPRTCTVCRTALSRRNTTRAARC